MFRATNRPISPDRLHLVLGRGRLAGVSDLTGYADWNFMFLVGPPKPDRL